MIAKDGERNGPLPTTHSDDDDDDVLQENMHPLTELSSHFQDGGNDVISR